MAVILVSQPRTGAITANSALSHRRQQAIVLLLPDIPVGLAILSLSLATEPRAHTLSQLLHIGQYSLQWMAAGC
jgi:hypothetical protein